MAVSTWSLSFDGVNDAGSASPDLSAQNKITLSFWLKWTTFANNDDFAFEYTANFNSNAGGFNVDPNASGGAFNFGMSTGNGTNFYVYSFTRPSAGAWHHYALEFDRVTPAVLAWVDGVSQSLTPLFTTAPTGNFANSTLNWMSRNGASLFGTGLLDQVAIFSGLLSGATIAGLASGATDPASLSPLAYWSIEEGSGTTTADSSGNGYTCTLAGGVAWSTDVPSQLAGSASFTIAPTTIPKNHSNNITLTLTGSGTSWVNGVTVFTPSGVTGVTKISQNVTSATAATVVVTTDATHTGTLTITESVTGTATATTTVATATLAISPTSGATGTTPTLTLTGTNTVWTQETAAGLFTVSGGTGASIGTPTITTDTAGTVVLTVGSGAGTLTITDTSTGATATFTATGSPVTLAVNNANWFWSPYNWFFSGSTYALAVNPGAYFRINFTGTSFKLNVDVTSMSGAGVGANDYPRIRYTVDGLVYTTYQLASGDTVLTLATGLASATHSLVCYFLASDDITARWNATECLKITSATVDFAAASAAPTLRTKRAIVYGDSITEGWLVLSSGASDTDKEDATAPWPAGVMEALGAEYGSCAFAGQGWDAIFHSDIPTLPDAWDFYFSTNSRLSGGLFVPAPDYLFCNMGANGGVSSSSTVQTWMGDVRAAAGSSCKIVMVIPFGGTGRTNITAGFNAYKIANPADLCYLVDLGTVPGVGPSSGTATFSTTDGVHPDIPTQGRLGADVVQAFQAQLAGGGGGGAPVVGSGIVRGRI